MANQNHVRIERLGGFAGFGQPGSHLKSKGEILTSDLSDADLSALDSLFDGDLSKDEPLPDSFRYRITRKSGSSEQTIEVSEHNVPLSLKNAVKDTLE